MADPLLDDAPEEEDDGPGWLTTWADMMSVLLTFFIVLQAFSTISEKKFYEAVSSIQQAFRVPLPIRSPGSAQFISQTTVREMEEMMSDQDVEGVNVEDFGDRIVLTVESELLFGLGRADLTGPGRRLMDVVATALKSAKGDIRIEGHTCDLPVGTGSEFSDNWELSTGRALTVLGALAERGIPPAKLAAAGYGEYRPVAPNDSEDNRQRNRRVEFVIEKRGPPADGNR